MHDHVMQTPLIRTAEHDSAERRALQRRARRGELVAIRPGVLVEPDALDALRPEARHLLLLRATASMVRPPRAISHASAAAVHGLPFVDTPPGKVQVTDPRRTHADATRLLSVHVEADRTGPAPRYAGTPPTMPTEFCGAHVTALVRTLVDVAATEPALVSVPMLDAALAARRVFSQMLVDELAAAPPNAVNRARVAIEMGSPLSDSPAESVARVRFRQLRTPEPVQQHVFARPGVRRAVVDFWFPAQGVVVEVDGRAKYGDGTASAEAHWDEKRREDFIRSFPEVRTVIRFSWADLMDPEVIRVALIRAGVPLR